MFHLEDRSSKYAFLDLARSSVNRFYNIDPRGDDDDDYITTVPVGKLNLSSAFAKQVGN
jgi:hypothetical protein